MAVRALVNATDTAETPPTRYYTHRTVGETGLHLVAIGEVKGDTWKKYVSR